MTRENTEDFTYVIPYEMDIVSRNLCKLFLPVSIIAIREQSSLKFKTVPKLNDYEALIDRKSFSSEEILDILINLIDGILDAENYYLPQGSYRINLGELYAKIEDRSFEDIKLNWVSEHDGEKRKLNASGVKGALLILASELLEKQGDEILNAEKVKSVFERKKSNLRIVRTRLKEIKKEITANKF